MARVPAISLTEKQADFVKYLAQGMRQGRAARLAGYSSPDQDACRLLRLQHVLTALERETARVWNADILPTATGRLRGLLRDRTLIGRPLIDALRIAFSRMPKLESKPDGEGSLLEMPVPQLEAELRRLQEVMRGGGATVIDNEPDNTVTDVPSEEDVFG